MGEGCFALSTDGTDMIVAREGGFGDGETHVACCAEDEPYLWLRWVGGRRRIGGGRKDEFGFLGGGVGRVVRVVMVVSGGGGGGGHVEGTRSQVSSMVISHIVVG